MKVCPICQNSFKRLDLHIMRAHPDKWEKPKQPVLKETPSPKAKLVRKLREEKPKSTVPEGKPVEPMPELPFVQPLLLADIKEQCDEGSTPATLKAIIEDTSWQRGIDTTPFGKKGMVSTKWVIIAIIAVIAIVMVLYFAGMLPGATQ